MFIRVHNRCTMMNPHHSTALSSTSYTSPGEGGDLAKSMNYRPTDRDRPFMPNQSPLPIPNMVGVKSECSRSGRGQAVVAVWFCWFGLGWSDEPPTTNFSSLNPESALGSPPFLLLRPEACLPPYLLLSLSAQNHRHSRAADPASQISPPSLPVLSPPRL